MRRPVMLYSRSPSHTIRTSQPFVYEGPAAVAVLYACMIVLVCHCPYFVSHNSHEYNNVGYFLYDPVSNPHKHISLSGIVEGRLISPALICLSIEPTQWKKATIVCYQGWNRFQIFKLLASHALILRSSVTEMRLILVLRWQLLGWEIDSPLSSGAWSPISQNRAKFLPEKSSLNYKNFFDGCYSMKKIKCIFLSLLYDHSFIFGETRGGSALHFGPNQRGKLKLGGWTTQRRVEPSTNNVYNCI